MIFNSLLYFSVLHQGWCLRASYYILVCYTKDDDDDGDDDFIEGEFS